ncbi:hypothetical protein Y032_0176g564 [Ancylostoma ceylanicum]|uniref:Secreted protein n=1 Tax=Ancylostoma ceylanicum TaxID=53326 RepID=A0A016SU91_9BILA|nr:hypothetical protein Y032_0176g564 [Ancylostoma ceylanicum]
MTAIGNLLSFGTGCLLIRRLVRLLECVLLLRIQLFLTMKYSLLAQRVPMGGEGVDFVHNYDRSRIGRQICWFDRKQ